MFKKISLIVAALVVVAAAQSQNYYTDRSGSEFGIHGGPGVSILYNQHPLINPRNPNKPVYDASAFGLTYQYNFPKIVSIRTELNFEQKGDYIYSVNNTTLLPEGSLNYYTLTHTTALAI